MLFHSGPSIYAPIDIAFGILILLPCVCSTILAVIVTMRSVMNEE